MKVRWLILTAIVSLIQCAGLAQVEPPRQPRESSPPAEPQGVATEGMTLADLEAIALAHHPTLRQAAARVRAARGGWLQAGLPPNPVVGYQASEIGNDARGGQQGAYLAQEFVTGGKLRLNRAAATQEIRQAEAALVAQRYRVLNDVRIAYYEVLAAQRTEELSQELVRIGEDGVRTADRLLKALQGSRIDLLQAKVEADSAKILLENARNRHAAAWRGLAAVAGAPGLAPFSLAGDLEEGWREHSWEEALGRLLSQSPELAAARAGVNRARWALSRARAEPIPNLFVETGVQHDNASHFDIANVQIGIPLPIFNRNEGSIRRAAAELAAARSGVSRIELDLQNRLRVAFERYANARQQARKYSEDILPNAQASLDLVAAAYRQGEFSFLTLLTAQRTFFETNLAYVAALGELWESSVTIEGLLLTGSLEER